MAGTNQMSPPLKDLLGQVVDFVGGVGHVLDKKAAAEKAFKAKIASTVRHLVEQGLVSATQEEKIASNLQADPSLSLDYMCKLSNAVQPSQMGKAAARDEVERHTGYNGRPRSKADDAFEARMFTQ